MMELVCTNCKKTFTLNPLEVGSASVEGALTHTYTFVCDHCHTPNKLTKAEFEAVKHAHETGAKPAMGSAPKTSMAPAPAMPAAKPMMAAHGRDDEAMDMPKPAAGMMMKSGSVLVSSLHVRKDHSTTSETVKGLVKGDKVTVMTTWTDGKNTWAQIGDGQWAAIEHDGKKMIELH